MWLKRLVGIVMIITCVGMNILVLVGFFSPVTVSTVGLDPTGPTAVAPMVTITAKPDAISAGSYSALTWTTTGSPETCTASGDWAGPKTAFGAESTGRVVEPGNYTYNLECTNDGGTSKATVSIAVGPASAPPPAPPKSNTSGSGSSGVTYCGGASPCYGPKEVATHSGNGNCWGWNGNRVINISGLDAGYHKAATGISSIEVSQVCGKDLAPSLDGRVSAEGQTRDHNPTTKANIDSNERPYFVGYFDSNKP